MENHCISIDDINLFWDLLGSIKYKIYIHTALTMSVVYRAYSPTKRWKIYWNGSQTMLKRVPYPDNIYIFNIKTTLFSRWGGNVKFYEMENLELPELQTYKQWFRWKNCSYKTTLMMMNMFLFWSILKIHLWPVNEQEDEEQLYVLAIPHNTKQPSTA